MRDINTAWCHGGAKITRCQHCTLGRSSLLFSPIWFTFIIYETCLTNPQQRFQIMIGICQRRIVFLKTITTVPGNVNMSIEGNTSLNKPIFCKNKTKSKKENRISCTEKGNLSSSELSTCHGQKNSSFPPDGGDTKAHFYYFPNYKLWSIQHLSTYIHETPWERKWQKSKGSCYSRNQT